MKHMACLQLPCHLGNKLLIDVHSPHILLFSKEG